MLRTPKLWEARCPLYRGRFLQNSFCSSLRDPQVLHTCAPLKTQQFRKRHRCLLCKTCKTFRNILRIFRNVRVFRAEFDENCSEFHQIRVSVQVLSKFVNFSLLLCNARLFEEGITMHQYEIISPKKMSNPGTESITSPGPRSRRVYVSRHFASYFFSTYSPVSECLLHKKLQIPGIYLFDSRGEKRGALLFWRGGRPLTFQIETALKLRVKT